MQEDNLAFVNCQLGRNSVEGFFEVVMDRDFLERLVASFLAEHLEFGDYAVGFDLVSMPIYKDNRGL